MECIDWERLFREFEEFQLGEEFAGRPAEAFDAAMISPSPDFVPAFLARRVRAEKGRANRPETARDLFAFLLHKRYTERLNLLFFAFDVFDDTTPLPPDIVAMTPFPHEDGQPSYRHCTQCDVRWLPPEFCKGAEPIF